MYSQSWFQILTPELQELIGASLQVIVEEIEEIRLRIARPILFRLGTKELTITPEKRLTPRLENGYLITKSELERAVQILSQNSLYAWENEFKNGYLTIPGGHRVGFVGSGVLKEGKIKRLKELSGINYRLGKEILGCAQKVLPYLVKEKEIKHTLIISPPRCGKTTLLRDLVRQISTDFPGVNVGVVDERSEIAGMYQGEPQFDIGLRTDVLDACPKAEGMLLLIRSMSPQVIVTDEIGKKEDVEALHNALQAGVKVITTVHGTNWEEIKRKPYIQTLANWCFFERIVVLSRRKGPGTLEVILDGKSKERLR